MYRLPRRAGLINQTPTPRNDAYAMTSRRSVLQCVVYEKQAVWTARGAGDEYSLGGQKATQATGGTEKT